MNEKIYEDFELLQIKREVNGLVLTKIEKPVISEISLKIIINGEEYASLLCMNQDQEDLALGFLYNEGVINSFEDVEKIYFYPRMFSVVIQLKAGIVIEQQDSLRSMTSGCGKCFTSISPGKSDQYKAVPCEKKFSMENILKKMQEFNEQPEIYRTIGGVHSALYVSGDFEVLNEDIGRHNCVDKIAGILLKTGRITDTGRGIIFISGRVSSEIMTKIVRLRIPVLVSRSTPTAAAVKLAQQYNVTLLGYVRGDSGFVYSAPERITC